MHLLRPTLCTSGFDRAKHLEFMTSIPERPAQLLLLQVCAATVPLALTSSLLCLVVSFFSGGFDVALKNTHLEEKNGSKNC